MHKFWGFSSLLHFVDLIIRLNVLKRLKLTMIKLVYFGNYENVYIVCVLAVGGLKFCYNGVSAILT